MFFTPNHSYLFEDLPKGIDLLLNCTVNELLSNPHKVRIDNKLSVNEFIACLLMFRCKDVILLEPSEFAASCGYRYEVYDIEEGELIWNQYLANGTAELFHKIVL